MNLQIYFIFFGAYKLSLFKTASELHLLCLSNKFDLNLNQILYSKIPFYFFYLKTNPISNQTFFVSSKSDFIFSRYAHSKLTVEVIELPQRDKLYSDRIPILLGF